MESPGLKISLRATSGSPNPASQWLQALGVVSGVGWLGFGLFLMTALVLGMADSGWNAPGVFPSEGLRDNLLVLVLSGLGFAALAALVALPLGLGTALVLTLHKSARWSRPVVRFFRGLCFLPSIVYGFLFCWYTGPFLQNQFQEVWIHFFRPEGWFAQVVAFAFTILAFPLTILSSQPVSIDRFYKASLSAITDFSQGSYSAFVIILSMVFFLTPVFVTVFFKYFNGVRKNRVQDAALAIGMSDWEGLQLSLVYGMKKDIRGVFFFGLGKAFAEGVSIFIVLNYFFIAGNWHRFFWAETYSAFMLKSILFHSLTWGDYLVLAGALWGIHWGLSQFYAHLSLGFDEELMG